MVMENILKRFAVRSDRDKSGNFVIGQENLKKT